jgi:ParB-like chromosome segregation protein Spo0J
MVSPIIIREDKNKFKLVDGHRRLRAMKSIGITEDIPVNVVLASDEEAKKAALIAIMVKAKIICKRYRLVLG